MKLDIEIDRGKGMRNIMKSVSEIQSNQNHGCYFCGNEKKLDLFGFNDCSFDVCSRRMLKSCRLLMRNDQCTANDMRLIVVFEVLLHQAIFSQCNPLNRQTTKLQFMTLAIYCLLFLNFLRLYNPL